MNTQRNQAEPTGKVRVGARTHRPAYRSSAALLDGRMSAARHTKAVCRQYA
jgi:hypothetical protein